MPATFRRRANWVSSSENSWSHAVPEPFWRRSVKVALRGKTILTTRAAGSTGDLTQRLTELGARVIECPTIELEPIENCTAIDQAIHRMNTYQWLMFTSANAVDYFMKRIAADHEVCRIPIAVVGSTTAKKLDDWKLSPSLMPDRFNAEGLLDAFPRRSARCTNSFPSSGIGQGNTCPKNCAGEAPSWMCCRSIEQRKPSKAFRTFARFSGGRLSIAWSLPAHRRFDIMAETLEDDLGTALSAHSHCGDRTGHCARLRAFWTACFNRTEDRHNSGPGRSHPQTLRSQS